MKTDRLVVLFLCTENSARSQMAEALLRQHAGDRIEVHSAGLQPQRIHPLTLRVLAEKGIDTDILHSKNLQKFLGRMTVNYAVIVCENAEQSCPRLYPFALETLYWPFDDPSAFEGSQDEKLEKFREVRDQIDERIQTWLNEIQ